MKKIRVGFSDVALPLLGLALLVGLLTVFRPCGPREDGGWMSCHWAGRAAAGAAGAMLLLSLLRLPWRAGVKRGLDLALIVLSALAALLPGPLISLCMMHDMRCHMLTKPYVLALSALTALTALADLLVQARKGKDHEI